MALGNFFGLDTAACASSLLAWSDFLKGNTLNIKVAPLPLEVFTPCIHFAVNSTCDVASLTVGLLFAARPGAWHENPAANSALGLGAGLATGLVICSIRRLLSSSPKDRQKKIDDGSSSGDAPPVPQPPGADSGGAPDSPASTAGSDGVLVDPAEALPDHPSSSQPRRDSSAGAKQDAAPPAGKEGGQPPAAADGVLFGEESLGPPTMDYIDSTTRSSDLPQAFLHISNHFSAADGAIFKKFFVTTTQQASLLGNKDALKEKAQEYLKSLPTRKPAELHITDGVVEGTSQQLTAVLSEPSAGSGAMMAPNSRAELLNGFIESLVDSF